MSLIDDPTMSHPSNSTQALDKKLSKVKVQAMLNKNVMFYTAIGLPLDNKFMKDHPMCKTAFTNGKYIAWDVDFLDSLSVKDSLFVYLHECAHIALEHVGAASKRNLDPGLLNMAQDYRINYDLVNMLGIPCPAGGLYDPQYDESWTSERIYHDLIAKGVQPPPSFSYDVDPNAQPDPNATMAAISKAAALAHAAGAAGSIPSEVKIALEKYYKPKINTKALLAKYISETMRKGLDFTKANKRFTNVIVPIRRSKAAASPAIILDTSGSVTNGEIQVFLEEIRSAFASHSVKKVHAVQFSTKIVAEDVITHVSQLSKLDIHGRGGTDIIPVFEWIKNNKPKVAVIFSDGDFYLPDKMESYPSTPLIWCIHDNPTFHCPRGVIIHYNAEGREDD